MAFQFPPSPTAYETVENTITGSTYQWRPELSKWVLTQANATGSDLIWEGDNPPDPIGDYKLWYSTDTLELYFYYCDANGVCAWVPTSAPITMLEDLGIAVAEINTELQENNFKTDQLAAILIGMEGQITNCVSKTGGDSMEGQLVINGPRKAGDDPDNPNLVSSVKVLNIDNAQNSSLQLRHGGNAKVYIGDTDVSIASDIKVVRAAGSVVKTDDADLINIKGEEVSYTGKIENEKNLVTKQYVDDADEALRQDIIELEEEIDAIAPSVEYGTWVWNNPSTLGRPPLDGEFYLLTETLTTTDDYINTKHIVINHKEYGGTGTHGWIDANPGKLIQLFDAADPDFLLGEITAKDIKDTYVIITVDLIQTNGTPGDNKDPNTDEYLTRINIFEKPSGGDASGFVLKTGDTMTGNLIIDKSTGTANVAGALTLKGERPDDTNSAATIKFENANNSANAGYLTYKSYGTSNTFSFDRDVELNNKDLTGVGNIRMKADGHIKYSTNDRIRVNSSGGSLRYSGSAKLFWGNNGVSVEKASADNVNGSGFTVKGKIHSSSYTNSGYTHADGDLLQAYHNANGQDAINYNGKITGSRNIATKEYVDSKMPTYKITKSNGNYYVQ